jgi:hypothetical protein
MEIKVECPCGQPFEFEVEPNNGRMPCAIQCPTCNADATELANRFIAEKFPLPTLSPPSAAPSGLRINREPAHVASPSTPVTLTSPDFIPVSAPAKTPKPESSGDGFVKGLVGALVGAVVGMLIWFFLIKATGYEIGWVAWGVGALTGVGARVVGADGCFKLGLVAGILAFLAIIGGQYLALRSLTMKEFDKLAIVAYQAQVEYAKQITTANSEADMKALYAKENDETVSDIKSQDWDDFNQKDLPKLKELAAGKPTEQEFVHNFHKQALSVGSEFEMLKESVGLFTLLWIFLGVGSAFKLASGRND